ncbi:MAG: SDR family NAD(P)-dependent oxidoreductase [Saprospiraceae bacterium]|nr:SDR family NAD(P)-dependent oxidoreductase [Saprospiraceae bacterium]MDZ4705071.1 SDR family NAD(P)-dependent oxidoreductase [Saprospiraceae bacterium]
MSTKSIALAYNIDNIALAESIEQHLSGYTGRFEHFYGTKEKSLAEHLQFFYGPIILLVTDNFLKSPQCMAQGLQFLQNKRSQLLPVVAEGRSREEQSGAITSVSTRFDRVSDIIQYINYWQDQYLDLRRQKRHLHDLDEDAFNAHLSSMRDISSDVGEYLRSLRGIEHLEYPAFAANDYEAFFNFMEDRTGWDRFRRERAAAAPGQEVSSPEPKAAPEPEVIEEAIDADHLEVDLTEIPGISQLDLSGSVEQPQVEEEHEPEMPSVASEQAPEEPAEANAQPEEPIEIIPEVVESPPAEVPVEAETPQPETALSEAGLSDDALIQLFQNAWSLADKGQVGEGITLLAEAVDMHPSLGLLRYHYALMLSQKGENPEGAKEQLEILLQADPENEDANFLAAEIAEGEGNFASARTHYEKVAAVNSDYPQVYDRLGNLLLQHFSEESEATARAFKKAFKKDPENAEAAYQYALLKAEVLNEPDKAVRYFKKTLAIQADHPFAWYDLALLYYAQDKKKEAHEAYLKAAENNPELKTEQNDQAFFYQKPEEMERHGSFEKDALEALKANIARLEALVEEREKQELEAQEAAAQEEPEEIPPAMPVKVDKTVLISGATSGIGKATAVVFAQNGYRIILTGRRMERLREVQANLQAEYGAEAEILAFDVQDAEATKAAIDSLQGVWKDIDILINNAGKAKGFSSIHEGDLAHWEEMIDTNIKGLLYLTRMVSPLMVARSSGHIINVGSNAGNEMYPKGNVYSATKAAVYALTKGMRYDLYTHNIRVSQVSPGHVDETEFALVRFDGDENQAKIYEDFKPLTAGDVADAIFFMASRPEYVNIQDMVLMGTQQASSTMIHRSGRQTRD